MADQIVDVKTLDFILDEEESLDFAIDDEESLDFTADAYINVATTDYNELVNKPQINGVTLIGNKTSADIHVQDPIDDITNQDIDNVIFG